MLAAITTFMGAYRGDVGMKIRIPETIGGNL